MRSLCLVSVLVCVLWAVPGRAEVLVAFQNGQPTPVEAGGDGSTLYTGTTDLHLREYVKDNNTGGEVNLVIGQYADNEGDDCRILIAFDFGTLGTYMALNGLTIQSATLSLYLNGTTGNSTTTGQTVDLFAATIAFNEGTRTGNGRDGSGAVAGESTWNNQAHPSGGWTSGGTHSPADWGTALQAGTALTTTGQWYDFDVTPAFALDGSNLAGHKGVVMLARVDDENPNQDNTQGGKQHLFNSSENSSAQKPKMAITLIPEPATLALVAAGALALLGRRR